MWSDPIDIDTVGTSVCVLEHKGQKAMFIVKVKAITGVQKQVSFSGRYGKVRGNKTCILYLGSRIRCTTKTESDKDGLKEIQLYTETFSMKIFLHMFKGPVSSVSI